MENYLLAGRLEISNNRTENAIRPFTRHAEDAADIYVENMLIPPDSYQQFLSSCKCQFTVQNIKYFASQIDRDPSIIHGRLLNDGKINYGYSHFKLLQKHYKIVHIKKVTIRLLV